MSDPPEARLAALGLTLPPVVAPLAAYVPAVRSGPYVYTAGQLPIVGKEATAARLLARMSEARLVELAQAAGTGQNGHGDAVAIRGEVRLTESGGRRARDVVRRHRLAERLFTDTFAIEDAEAHQQACRFEHIITPELDQRICSFLGHPKTCPHGNPIPPGPCCEKP